MHLILARGAHPFIGIDGSIRFLVIRGETPLHPMPRSHPLQSHPCPLIHTCTTTCWYPQAPDPEDSHFPTFRRIRSVQHGGLGLPSLTPHPLAPTHLHCISDGSETGGRESLQNSETRCLGRGEPDMEENEVRQQAEQGVQACNTIVQAAQGGRLAVQMSGASGPVLTGHA